MILTISLIFFLFGLIIGSFLNVVIYRYNTKTFGGRSCCLSCSNQLCWPELIPLLSFLAQGGRCRNCQASISIQYPLVEFTTGVIFMLLCLKFQDIFLTNLPVFALTFAYYGAVFALLLVIAVYDFKHKIIPDRLSLFVGLLAFAGLFFFKDSIFSLHVPQISEFLAGIFLALPLALLWLCSRGKWMGLGDAKLALGLGWILGISKILSGILISFWSGAIIGIILIILSKKYGVKSEVPFAPFLVFGTFLVFILELHIFVF